jgi:hypothetical protein
MSPTRFIAPFLALVLATASPFAQPRPALTGANTACDTGPIQVNGAPDTLSRAEFPPDDSGFVKIFNGKNLKGWWEGCGSTHSSADNVNGGIWLVDSANGLLFANQNTNGAGSVLMTNKSYLNYELVFDLWPSFGNDAGVFNRVTPSGNTYQTGIDYVSNSSIGGAYFEGGYTGTSRNYDPYVFQGSKSTIILTHANTNVNNRLDSITKRFANPVDFGCPATGCGPANWTAVWDTGGWNQMRVKFYGTGASASNKVHNFAWIRKLGAAQWVPTLRDSVQFNTPAAPLGLQIHGGTTYWTNRNGNWYRNIRIRPLNDQGEPILPTSAVSRRAPGPVHGLRVASGVLSGKLDSEYEILVRDAGGRVLERASGPAGELRHVVAPSARGILLVQVRTAKGVEHLRVGRISE